MKSVSRKISYAYSSLAPMIFKLSLWRHLLELLNRPIKATEEKSKINSSLRTTIYVANRNVSFLQDSNSPHLLARSD